MIDNYFELIERTILDFKAIINSYAIYKKTYSEKQGFIKGEILFKNNSQFRFIEVKNTELKRKLKYRYQFMDKDNRPIFRYDNAYHHRELKTFPHHKHIGDKIQESNEPDLYELLIEIQKFIKRGEFKTQAK
jgi:hypothetical protein